MQLMLRSYVEEAVGENVATPKVSVGDMLRSVGLSDSPMWYAGVQANDRDLGRERLERLYGQVRDNVSPEAASALVRLIRDSETLAPAGFVQSVLNLAGNGWRYRPVLMQSGMAPLDPRADFQTNEFAMLAAAASAGVFPDIPARRDETLDIKQAFMVRHKLPEDPIPGRRW